MAIDIALPTLITVITTALIDSINPCAIGVLVLLISTILITKRKEKMLKIGLVYIATVFLTYLLLGVGLTYFLASIPILISQYISIAVGTLVVIAGIFEIKDYFWYGQGLTLSKPAKQAQKIKAKIKKVSLATIIFLGVFVAAVELPCTGGPYLAITLLLSQNFNFLAFMFLIIYNLIFVMPLIIILFLILLGVNIKYIANWKQTNKQYMRLATGILLILLGWLLVLIANGTINLN